MVKVFSPEADLLAVIAHSAIKGNQYILAENCITLHYLDLIDQYSIEKLINLVARENKLVNAFRWHLTITSILHNFASAHGVEYASKYSNLCTLHISVIL